MDTRFLENIFLSTLKYRESSKTIRNDFVDLLLSLRENFSQGDDVKFGEILQKKKCLLEIIKNSLLHFRY